MCSWEKKKIPAPFEKTEQVFLSSRPEKLICRSADELM